MSLYGNFEQGKSVPDIIEVTERIVYNEHDPKCFLKGKERHLKELNEPYFDSNISSHSMQSTSINTPNTFVSGYLSNAIINKSYTEDTLDATTFMSYNLDIQSNIIS